MSFALYSSQDLTRAQLDSLFARADELANGATANVSGARVGTALFNTAFPLPVDAPEVLRAAGAEIISIALPDRTHSTNANVILFSSPQTQAAFAAAEKLNAAFLNVGDGTHENPVRALMDAYAIRVLKGDLSKSRVAILGNAKFSAEAHSLALLLGAEGAPLTFVTTAALSMPYDLTDQVRLNAYEVEETNDLTATLRKTDALYLANIDPIRVEKKIYDKQKTFFSLTPDAFAEAKPGLVVLGEWDGAEALLAATRPQVTSAARAMLLALVEFALK